MSQRADRNCHELFTELQGKCNTEADNRLLGSQLDYLQVSVGNPIKVKILKQRKARQHNYSACDYSTDM